MEVSIVVSAKEYQIHNVTNIHVQIFNKLCETKMYDA